MLSVIFSAMDADGSGHVDAEEFKSIFSDIGEKHAHDRMREIDNVRGRGDSDGRLTSDEFVDFMMEYLADINDHQFKEKVKEWEGHLASSHRKLLLRRVFARMDVDKSGTVSLEEFKAIANDDVGAENSAAFFKWIEGATGNNDGDLTSDEWVPFVLEMEAGSTDEEFHQLVDDWLSVLEKKRRTTLLRQVFAKMDADSSGEVDLAEFEAMRDGSADDEALFMVFHYLDGRGNSDGMLSLGEWLDGMKEMSEDLSDADFEAEIAKWMALLTANQRAIWRGCYGRGHARELVIAARAAGATHALFVQHAHVDPAATATPTGAGASAAGRAVALTNRGSAQCMVARDEWFGRLPVRRMLLTSPALCVRETALHMSGQAHLLEGGVPSDAAPLLTIESLHPGSGGHAVAEEIGQQKLGLPLRELLDAEGGETAFGLYAEAACEEITAKFRAIDDKSERATYVAAFGHPGFVTSVAYAVATAAGVDGAALDTMLDLDLDDSDGILVPLYGDGKQPLHLKRPL